MKKVAWFIIVILLVSNLVIGTIAKMNFNYTNGEKLLTVQTWSINFKTMSFQKEIVDIQNLDELFALSDKVSLIQCIEEPSYYQNYINHSIKVIKDFKQDDQTVDINLLEPVWLSREKNENIMSTVQGYIPLENEEIYIVFLQKAEKSYLDHAYTYTHPFYTKFRVQEGGLKIISGSRNTFATDELSDSDLIDFNQPEDDMERNVEQMTIYKNIKLEFYDRYLFE